MDFTNFSVGGDWRNFSVRPFIEWAVSSSVSVVIQWRNAVSIHVFFTRTILKIETFRGIKPRV